MLRSIYQEEGTEAGCDEAGRGCLAGPVFAAAVILSKNFSVPFLNDSKKLSVKQRFKLRKVIESQALAWAVSRIDPHEIDRINIANASYKAMNQSVKSLELQPDRLLIDGNRFKSELGIPFVCIIGGDGKYASIAAASILAKTYRDEYMIHLHSAYPHYSWNTNKGYPTEKHRQGILKFGITSHHRKSFNLTVQGKLF